MKKLKDLSVKENDNVLSDIVSSLTKKFKGSRILANNDIDSDVKFFINTNIIPLNKILGNGFPTGKIIELFGHESGGKSTLAQYFIAQANKQGYLSVYIDGEYSLEKKRAKQLGLDDTKILYHTPETLEEAYDFILYTLDLFQEKAPNKPVLVLMDSLAAFPSEHDLKGDIGEIKVGGTSKINAQAFKILSGKLAKCNATLIIINQLRDNIGVMFGDKSTTPGGRALKFFAAVRLKTTRKEYIKDGDKIIGIISEVSAVKNKLAPPFGKCLIPIYFNRDDNCLDNAESVFHYITENEIAKKESRGYSYKDISFSEKTFKDIYLENKELFDKAVMEY
jgi:recombination protein RecA